MAVDGKICGENIRMSLQDDGIACFGEIRDEYYRYLY